MTTPSPTLILNGASPGAAVDVTGGSTVNGSLANPAGANKWTINVTSTDDGNSAAAVAATLVINQTNKTFTVTAPVTAGSCVILQSIVGVNALGVDGNGVSQQSFTTTTQFNVLTTGGLRVLAANEGSELSPTFGWISKVNASARNPPTGSFGQSNVTLSNGLNSNVNTGGLPVVRVGGPTTAFSIDGFAKPTSAQPNHFVLWNITTQTMTLVHQGSGSSAANRLTTIRGTSVVATLRGGSSAEFTYDTTFNSNVGGWVLTSIGYAESLVINVKDYGADPTGSVDATAAIQAAINAAITGSTIFFPGFGAVYKVTQPLVITASAVRFRGESCGSIGGATITFVFAAVATGIHGTVTSVANNGPTSENNINATFTLGAVATGAATNILPGDTIVVGNGNSPSNNNPFSIIAGGTTTCTYYGRNNTYQASGVYIPDTSDAHNGSLTWAVYHPAIKCYGTQATIFENLTFDGTGTVGAVFDVTFGGTSNVGNGFVVSNMQWHNCYIKNGVFGIKVGDFSGWVAPAATINWPNNTDQFVLRDTYFQDNSFAGFFVPNASGQSKYHHIVKCTFQSSAATEQYGINIRTGSFSEDTCVFTSHTLADRFVQNAWDAITIRGSSSESSPRALIVGAGSFTGPYPISIIGCRFDTLAANLAGDGHYIKLSYPGGLSLKNCTFSAYDGVAASTNSPFGAWTIGVLGYTAAGINQTVSVDIENCVFPAIAPNAVVTVFGPNDAFWRSAGNFTTLGNVAVEGPNGIIAAFGNPDTQRTPVSQLLSLAFPEAPVTLVNGNNNNLAIGYSNAYCTGPTAACTITGIVAPGMSSGSNAPADVACTEISFTFKFNQNVTIANASGSSAAANQILTPTGADVLLTAAGVFTTAKLRYSTTLSKWLLLSA